jgi:hypothetical protein
MLDKEGFEKYPLYWIVGQNIFLFVYFGIGSFGMLPLQVHGFPVISTLYILFLAVMLLALRKHLCTYCYYYGKRCNTGWGKLSSLMFKENSGNYKLGIKFAIITWTLAALIPVFGIALALILNYSTFRLVLFVLFVLLTPINFLIHKKMCEKCKMRFTCPLSMKR